MRTCLVLYSGGLDSRLTIKIMLDAGVEVVAFHALHLFAGKTAFDETRKKIKAECLSLGAKDVIFAETTANIVELLRCNRFGFGKNLNPCIDCRLSTILTAARAMREIGADFLATGEVLGQRPKSQQRFGLSTIDKNLPADLQGLLLRPLSAKLLSPTIPELNGWIGREKLYAINGRSRNAQIALAEKFAIGDFPNPAGGCLLTDGVFSTRMRELLKRQTIINDDDIELLKVGRHINFADGVIVIARDSNEGDILEKLARPHDKIFITQPLNGALVLLRDAKNTGEIAEKTAQQYAAHYSKYRNAKNVEILRIENGAKNVKIIAVEKLTEE